MNDNDYTLSLDKLSICVFIARPSGTNLTSSAINVLSRPTIFVYAATILDCTVNSLTFARDLFGGIHDDL